MKLSATVTAMAVLLAATWSWQGATATERKPPYWASIAAGQARLRTGPGRNFPASWLYLRADLPVKVIETYPSWRKIEDPDGAQGWMMVNLLSEQRTAIITGPARPLRTRPDRAAPVLWLAAPGVVGRITHCAAGWCQFDVHGRKGYVEAGFIWGLARDETIE